ncbi:MAG: choice-of-anchor Q domain-containing protein [Rudaea sp.]
MRKYLPNTHLGTCAALAASMLIGSHAAVGSPIAAAVLARYLAVDSPATTRQVTSCADDGSEGTLRATIALAGGGDTIDLSGLPASDPACTSSTITLSQGEIAIPHNLTLLGPSDATLLIAASGANRVLNSTSTDLPSAYLRVISLTIARGANPTGYGGCIYGRGEVLLDHATVTDCAASDYSEYNNPAFAFGGGIFANSVTMTNGSVVSGNRADYSGVYDGYTYGGGIYARTNFTCVDSTISNNSAINAGGGVFVAHGNITLTRCTLDLNTANVGGGVVAYGPVPASQLEIEQSTISGNAASRGGGVYTRLPATISNSTIAFNRFGGGIQSSANVVMVSTIVARNHNNSGSNADIALASGKTLTGSKNLVMSSASFPPGVIVSESDPLLAPLANHGGVTRTHALLPGSPALNTGANTKAVATDQRGAGFAREVPTGMPDIGAYERQLNDDEIFGNGFE